MGAHSFSVEGKTALVTGGSRGIPAPLPTTIRLQPPRPPGTPASTPIRTNATDQGKPMTTKENR